MSVAETTNSIHTLLAQLPQDAEPGEQERQALLSACSSLRARLETPLEAMTNLTFAPHKVAAIRICMNAGVFDAMARSTGSAHTVGALASATGADAVLLARLLRVLALEGFVREEGPGSYTALAPAKLLVQGTPFCAGLKHFEVDTQVVSALPAYFAARGYANPGDAYDGPFQYATGHAQEHYFAWLAARPAELAAFNAVMQLDLRNRGPEWFDLYPVAERLGPSNASAAPTLLVDIGGGVGRDLAAFAARFPALEGRLVLQDLPAVIASIPADPPLPARIEPLAHDMFAPQPVIGARAYYMRTVLHDWPDDEARKVLHNVARAMDERSVLLVSEKVMPETHAPSRLVYADLSMMVQFAALERTKAQWVALFESAGLRVTGTWEPSGAAEGARTLFEARLKGPIT